MSGTRTIATRMEPLKAQVASIHARLRVWILPLDSNVESSNMACLPTFSRTVREAEGFGGAILCSRRAEYLRDVCLKAESDSGNASLLPVPPAIRSSRSEPLCWCRHHPRAKCSRGRANSASGRLNSESFAVLYFRSMHEAVPLSFPRICRSICLHTADCAGCRAADSCARFRCNLALHSRVLGLTHTLNDKLRFAD